jgi:hypothetical protein
LMYLYVYTVFVFHYIPLNLKSYVLQAKLPSIRK